MLLYLIEALAPLLTGLLVWAGWLAFSGSIARHKKVAVSHAVSTWLSYVVVIALVRMGHAVEGNAAKWIVDTHLVIIYLLPPALVALMATGLKGFRSIHRKLAYSYIAAWTLALITGAMIFLSHRGYI